MKHTRNIIAQQREEFSCPAFESIEIPDYCNDAELAVDLETERTGIEGRLEESEDLDNRGERMGTMADFVEQNVNPAQNTPLNEVALIEQVADANLDGTGIEVEEVMPSLESYVGSTVSLEAFKDSVTKILKAAGQLISDAKDAFVEFMKVTFSRLAALKKRIGEVESKVSGGDFSEKVEVPKGLASRALVVGNTVIDNAAALNVALDKFLKDLKGKGVGLSELVVDEYDKFLEVVLTASSNTGRGKDKDRTRRELRAKLVSLFNDFQKKAEVIYGKEATKELGNFYTGPKFGNEVKDEKDIPKMARATLIDLGPAANAHSKPVEFSGLDSASATAIIRKLKTAVGNLATFTRTDSMGTIDWASAELSGFATWIDDGEDTRDLWSLINNMSRMYTRLYTAPVAAYTTHFFKVANAELDLIEKAVV